MRKKEIVKNGVPGGRIKDWLTITIGAFILIIVIMLLMSIGVNIEIFTLDTAKIGSMVVITLIIFLASVIGARRSAKGTLVTSCAVTAMLIGLLLVAGIVCFGGKREVNILWMSLVIASGIAAGLLAGKKQKIKKFKL